MDDIPEAAPRGLTTITNPVREIGREALTSLTALQRGEPGIGLLIAKANVPVLPVRIFGAFEALPRHLAFPRPHTITVVFGKPWTYDPAAFKTTGKELYQSISDHVMERIGDLHL